MWKNTIRILNNIIEEKVKVIITDNFDAICKICPMKKEQGCDSPGKFTPSEKTAEGDKEYASRWKIKIGTIYQANDLLKMLRIKY